MTSTWRLALRNLGRNKRRNATTGFAIAFGVAGLLLLGGYAGRIERFLRANAVFLQHAGHVAVFKPGGLTKAAARPLTHQLDAAEQKAVRALLAADPRVDLVGAWLRGVGLAGNGCRSLPFEVLGVEPAVLAKITSHPELMAASPELAAPVTGRWPGQRQDGAAVPAALSVGLARLLGKPHVAGKVPAGPPAPAVLDCDTDKMAAQLAADAEVQLVAETYDGTFAALQGEIAATFHTASEAGEDGTVIAPLAALQELYQTDRATYMAAFLRNADDAAAVAADLRAQAARQGLKVEVHTVFDEAYAPYYVGTMAFIGSMFGFITLLVAGVVVLTVLGAMTLTILERTREVGMFRALGFSRRQVTALLVREAAVLSGIAVAGGIAIGFLVAAGVNAANIRFRPPGVPGDIQLLIWPTPAGAATIAAVLVPLALAATWLAVRGKVRSPVAALLAEHSG